MYRARDAAIHAQMQASKIAAEKRQAFYNHMWAVEQARLAANSKTIGKKTLQMPRSGRPTFNVNDIQNRLVGGGIVLDMEMDFLDDVRKKRSEAYQNKASEWQDEQQRIQTEIDRFSGGKSVKENSKENVLNKPFTDKNTSTKSSALPMVGGDGFLIFIIVFGILLTGSLWISSERRHGVSTVDQSCNTTLVNCWDEFSNKGFDSNAVIDSEEFTTLLDSIAEDLDSFPRSTFDIARIDFDTPFFDGNGNTDSGYPDNIVCIEDKCSNQSYVNYVAQGMYHAAAGGSEWGGEQFVRIWNIVKYGHNATDDEIYWFEYGYNYYKENYAD